MKKDYYILIMQALEGTLSNEETQEFERLLENNPEVRTAYQNVQRISEGLQRTAADSFAPSFADRVMQGLAPQQAERFASLGDMLASLFARFAPVALGLVVILGVYNVTTSSVEDQSPIEAALGLPEVSVNSAWESALASFDSYADGNDVNNAPIE